MADSKISELTELTSAANNDVLAIVDTSSTETKKIEMDTISTYVRNRVTLSDVTNVTSTELNILDGATVSTTELNILDGVTATTTELNILDGVTSTTAELNILDGVTATATEINVLDGLTGTIVTSDGSGVNGTPTDDQIIAWDDENSRLYWKDDGGGGGGGEDNVQSDWDVTDNTSDAFILNKPTTITSDQATAIVANTAKTSFPGFGTTNTTALVGDTLANDQTVTGDWTFRDTLDVEHTNTNALLSLSSNRSAPVPGLGGFIQFFANNDANAQVRAGTITGALTSITDDDEAGRFQFWLRDPDNVSNSTSDTATSLQMTITHDGVKLEQPLTIATIADGVTTDKILSVTSDGLVQQVDYPSGGSGDVSSDGSGIEGTPTNNQVVAWDNTNSRLYWKDDDTGSGTFSTSTDYTITGDWTFNENFTIGANDNRDGVVTIWPDVIFRGGQFNEDFAAYGNNILGSSNNADTNSIRGTNTFTGSLQIPDDAAATQVDGQIWYDTTNDKIMGRIDGADVDLGNQGTDNTLNAAISDVLSLSGQEISAVDAGTADAVVGWDDSASKLTYLTAADARAAIGAINAADNVDATGNWTFAENLTVGATDNRDGTVTFWPDVIFRGGQFNEDFATYGNSTFGSSDNSDTNKYRGTNEFTGTLVVPTAVAATQANGQIWYDTTDHVMYGRVNGANVSLSSVTAGNTVNANISDIVSLTGEEINGVDAGDADALVGWDDSASKLTYLSAADARAAISAVSSADAVTITKNWQFDENVIIGATDNRDATVTIWPDITARGLTVNDDLAVYGDTILGSSDNSDSASIRGTITTTGSLAIPTASPGTLANGQIWHLTNDFFTRINGSTVGLVGDNGMGINGTPTGDQVVAWDGTNNRLYWKNDATGGGGSFDASADQTITGDWTFSENLTIGATANRDGVVTFWPDVSFRGITVNDDLAVYGNTTIGSSNNSDTTSIRGTNTFTGSLRLPLDTPSTLTDGQIWYDDTADTLNARINGATVDIGAGGGGSDFTTDVTITKTDPKIQLKSDETAADDNEIGRIDFIGKNDASTPEDVTFASIVGIAEDITDGSEDGYISFYTDGSERFRIEDSIIETYSNMSVSSSIPDLSLTRTGSASAGSSIGQLNFYSPHSGSGSHSYGRVECESTIVTSGSEEGLVKIGVAKDGFSSGSSSATTYEFGPDHVYSPNPIRIGANNAANELDDYEEGTANPSADLIPGVTFDSPTGTYVKIGRLVFWEFDFIVNDNSSTTEMDSIIGQPFSNSHTNSHNPVGQWRATDGTLFGTIIMSGGASVELLDHNNNTLTGADVADKRISSSITYETNE